PYIGYAQLASLHQLLQARTPALRALAEAAKERRLSAAAGALEKRPSLKLSDALARWQLSEADTSVRKAAERQTGVSASPSAALDEAREAGARAARDGAVFSEETFFDLLDLADATRDPQHIRAALEAAYHDAAKVNLYPMPPEMAVTVDRGGKAPVHYHSFGRHKNQWGFPPPQPLRVPEQTVPAWRIARLGLPGIAYPIEYWMNTHGAMMRAASLAHDDFLRDIARWGMVGRFGNFPGDNRSQDSLVPELPDAVERMPWEWNFATVNAGHAWDFAGAVLDFLVSDAFNRSQGAIDFPALSAAGSNFRVRIYGGKPGKFYGDDNVHLWLPRGFVTCDNRQFDWVAGHGNGQLYLAVWNQSFREEKATLSLSRSLVECDAEKDARVWRDNATAAAQRVADNQLHLTIAPKGIVAFAIPANVKPLLQARLYDANTAALPAQSLTEITAPFGKVHVTLLRAGRGLTSAFVYTEALPENVVAARLRWRQGDGAWRELTDEIYPYEFSPELRDDAGDFECVFEIEDAQQRLLCSPVITLAMGKTATAAGAPSDADTLVRNDSGRDHADRSVRITEATVRTGVSASRDAQPAPPLADDFVGYLQRTANENNFGLRADGRYYPYSTPQGRRIAWRQSVWDKALFAHGCTREEAEQHLRADLERALADVQVSLAKRTPAAEFAKLDQRQQETLIDFAYTEGVASLRPDLLAAVLAGDWTRVVGEHLYVRYAGHAPDHARNKAFARRWNIQ
ncbi:MAG TPA: hypothetical protein VK643_00615, partial [Burkholderiales bacterium]|nr:hypothetical protein [Burkholderiales bacterium]